MPGRGLLLTGRPALARPPLLCNCRGTGSAGYGVQYDMTANILRRSRTDALVGPQTLTPNYLTCDLLVMDDLGSEYATSVTLSELFTLINTDLSPAAKPSSAPIIRCLSWHKLHAEAASVFGQLYHPAVCGRDLRMKRRQTKA
jgi:DNA replication protein DnaC